MNRLLNIPRYRACREIFRSPLRAHLALSFLSKSRRRGRPTRLDFRLGGKLAFAVLGRWKRVWDMLLGAPEGFSPIGAEQGLMYLHYRGSRVFLRPGTMDVSIFKETHLDDDYGVDTIAEPLDVVIDLGANTGLFTSRVMPLARRVIAVEPIAANRRVAELNIAGCTDKPESCALLPFAVAAESGHTIRLHLAELSGSHSVSRDWAEAHSEVAAEYEEAETISLADLMEREGVQECDLLKCDVEGSEYEIFGAAPLDVLRRIRRIVMEVHLDEEGFSRSRYQDLRGGLEQAGFAVDCGPERRSGDSGVTVLLLNAAREPQSPTVVR